MTSVNEKLVIFGRSNQLRWHDKSADSLGVGLITSGPVDVSAQHEITGTADVIQEMHRKSGWRFSVVVKRSCSGLIVQSPRIHYGIDCVSIQDVYLCHNAALYYPSPPLQKHNKTKQKTKKTIELLSHTFVCPSIVLCISKKGCSGTGRLAGLRGAVLGQPGTALPQSAALYCLSISRSIHYSSAPSTPGAASQLPESPSASRSPSSPLSSLPLLSSPLTSRTYLYLLSIAAHHQHHPPL